METRARPAASSQSVPELEEKGTIQILGFVKYHGKTCFAVHFDGNPRTVIVEPRELKDKFPRDVIKFYESCIIFAEKDQIPIKTSKEKRAK